LVPHKKGPKSEELKNYKEAGADISRDNKTQQTAFLLSTTKKNSVSPYQKEYSDRKPHF